MTLACALIACLPTAAGADLRIEVRLPAAELKDAYVEVWTASAAVPVRLQPRVVSTTGDLAVLLVPGACDPALRMVLHGGEVVSKNFTAPSEGCDGPPLPVEVFRSGRVTGELAGLDARGPTRASVHVRRCHPTGVMSETPVLSTYPVTVDEHGRWTAALPALCLALELRVQPHAPLRWTEVRLAPMVQVRLGLRVLTPAAAARLNVHDRQGRPVAGASVYAIPAREWTDIIDTILDGRELAGVIPAVTGSGGHVVIDELSPGVTRFIVLATGMAPGFSEPVVLESGGEYDVPPVTLVTPRRLTVRVERDPSMPGRAEVRARPVVATQPMGGAGATATPTEDGAEFASLFPGTWRISAIVFDDGFGQTAAEADVLIGDSDETVSLPLFAGYFTGQLLRDGLPLSGHVEVNPAADGLRATAVANDDGMFRVHLPGPGVYHVVYHGSPEETGAAVDVRFDSPGEVVSVHLRNGAVSGRVVDAQGAPVHGATVRLEYRELILKGVSLSRAARSDAEGRFVASGLPEGEWHISATAGDRVSQTEQVELQQGRAAPVQLTVRSRRTVTGTVLSPDGERAPGISGVTVVEIGDDLRMYRPFPFRTNDAGEFILRLPHSGPQALNVEVHGMEQGLTAVRAEPSDRVEVRLPRSTGSVVIRFDEALQTVGGRPAGLVLVNDTGAYIWVLSVLGRPHAGIQSFEGGILLHIDHLAPGRWRLVSVLPDDRQPFAVYRDDPSRLAAEFTILPGQVVTVTSR